MFYDTFENATCDFAQLMGNNQSLTFTFQSPL